MIIGAGSAGCYLGKLLGDCEIWEMKKNQMEKTCGGLFSKNIRDLDIDFSESLLNEIKGARFFAGKENFEIEKKKTQAYVVDRFKFNKELIQDAENENCKILWNKKWNGENDNFIIGADGANSAVAKSMNVNHKILFTYQVECELKNKKDSDFVELYFEKYIPKFFGWWIPFDEKTGRLGLGCVGKNPADAFKEFEKKFEIKKINKIQSAVIPIYDGKKTTSGNKALVGDAAGQVKASSGGGVIFGCKCAEVLKTAIDKNDLRYYEKNWRKKYEPLLKDHHKAWKFYNKVNLEKLFKVIKEKNVNELIEKYGDMENTSVLKKELLKRPDLWLSFAKAFV